MTETEQAVLVANSILDRPGQDPDDDVALLARQFIRTQSMIRTEALGVEIGATEAIRLAYGLLWHMQIDRDDPNLRLASDARRALRDVLTNDERADGIARAKATDGRFTGAA